MSSFYTYRDIRYELKETQGFYYCLVFAEGEDTALFQTKYYASIDGATTAAINFIDDYATYRKKKDERGRFRRQKPPEEKEPEPIEEPQEVPEEDKEERVRPRQLFEGTNLLQSAVPDKEAFGTRNSKALESKRLAQTSKVWQENGEIRSSAPSVGSGQSLRSRLAQDHSFTPIPRFVEDEAEKKKSRPLPVILLVGVALISIAVVIASASGFLESILQGDEPGAGIPPTETQIVEETPTLPEATIGLPAVVPTDTLEPSSTPTSTTTGTTTITVTSTMTPTRVVQTATNTPRPQNTPQPTNTFTPVPTATITPTPSFTPSITPTFTPSLTPSITPTFTPTPTVCPYCPPPTATP